MIVASVVLLIGLYIFVMRTKTGKAMRAVAEDKQVAALMGIDVDRVIVITFAIGAAMAGAAGLLYALLYRQVFFLMGFIPGIKAFTAAVLGGIGNVVGAALGGLFLGMFEADRTQSDPGGPGHPGRQPAQRRLRLCHAGLGPDLPAPGHHGREPGREKGLRRETMQSQTRFDWGEIIRLGLLMGIIALSLCLIGMVESFDERDIIGGVITLGQILLFGPVVGGGYLFAQRNRADQRPATDRFWVVSCWA